MPKLTFKPIPTMLGWGKAKEAAEEIKNRQKKIDEAIDAATGKKPKKKKS